MSETNLDEIQEYRELAIRKSMLYPDLPVYMTQQGPNFNIHLGPFKPTCGLLIGVWRNGAAVEDYEMRR